MSAACSMHNLAAAGNHGHGTINDALGAAGSRSSRSNASIDAWQNPMSSAWQITARSSRPRPSRPSNGLGLIDSPLEPVHRTGQALIIVTARATPSS